ncbi:DUF1294 domain-containing protein [Bacillus sp. 165]|uniref:DUF1294 domain-containing protein n=1 Tax=Bacillus sp. 165 TaxID=1529117 RepID=UPI001ADA60FB|nr:DUF1294 domain-containing protein [Bacillus sp. 165]MBO9129105.1 DUF1294 domain-containing protein [Bacillus sp. 165]
MGEKILWYIAAINLISLLYMGEDKRRAKNGSWRISENTLFLLAAIGGALGGLVGMYLFRHKTRKSAFVFGFPLLLIVQIGLIVYFKF